MGALLALRNTGGGVDCVGLAQREYSYRKLVSATSVLLSNVKTTPYL